MARESNEVVMETSGLTIRFSGRSAENQSLPLDQYWQSLQGWSEFFEIASAIYRRSATTNQGEPVLATMQIRIIAERRGSYDVVLGFVLSQVLQGVIGNRSDALFVWTFKALMKWTKVLFSRYLAAKRNSTDVQKLVESLEKLTQEMKLSLLPIAEELAAQDEALKRLSDELEILSNAFSAERLLIERMDTAIKNATVLLGEECDEIALLDEEGKSLLKLDRDDYEILHEDLTLPPPEGRWHMANVRFERINIKTGKALIYIEWHGFSSSSTVHARIADDALGAPLDPYTQALTRKETLRVWARQVRAERGRLNLMWEISVKPPVQRDLWDASQD
jgi:hypothetical protein